MTPPPVRSPDKMWRRRNEPSTIHVPIRMTESTVPIYDCSVHFSLNCEVNTSGQDPNAFCDELYDIADGFDRYSNMPTY